MIRIICQWCGDLIGVKDGHGVSGTSHGICEKCNKLTEAQQMAIYSARLAKVLS